MDEIVVVRKLTVPKIPEEQWCDFRKDYEAGLSLEQVAVKYFCDKRTVRTAIQQNRSSQSLGKRMKPTLISGYEQRIFDIWRENGENHSLLAASRMITESLREDGFSGSERTVRNYLKKQPYAVARMEEEYHVKVGEHTQSVRGKNKG